MKKKISSFFRHLPYAIWFAVVIYKINSSSNSSSQEEPLPHVYVQLSNVHDTEGKPIGMNASYVGREPKGDSKVFVLASQGNALVINDDSRYPKTDTAWYEGSTFFHITEAKVL